PRLLALSFPPANAANSRSSTPTKLPSSTSSPEATHRRNNFFDSLKDPYSHARILICEPEYALLVRALNVGRRPGFIWQPSACACAPPLIQPTSKSSQG